MDLGTRSGCHSNVPEIKAGFFFVTFSFIYLFIYLFIILLVSVVSVVAVVSFGGFVSVVSFRSFRFVVSGFSRCPREPIQLQSCVHKPICNV